MKNQELAMMSAEELWALHENICSILATKLDAEKHQLECRLAQLNGHSDRERRPYPKVLPKYQNPSEPAETWSGRGKQPRWLVSALKAGGKIEDFKISNEIKGKARASH